jgi:polyisoprenyl-teichoic acid--peptidoglycan teichoic acid transferase
MAQSRTSKKNRKKLRRKRVLRVFLLFFLLSIIGGGTFLAFNTTSKLTNAVYQEVDQSKFTNQRIADVEITKDPFNVLLVGIEDQGGGARSDVLMLLTVDPSTEKVYIVSIPRDTRTYIEAAGYKTKITESYSHGGIESTLSAVSELLDVPIDYFISTNFQGFEDVVDTLDGVTVDVPFTFKAQLTGSLKWKTFYEGENELNGNEALAYVRMRKSDPKGDLGRNERQQQVIKEIVNKSISLNNMTKMDDLIGDLGENVKTNIPPSKMTSFVNLYLSMNDAPLNRLSINGEDQYINNIYYFIPDEDSIDQVSDTLNDVLNSTSTLAAENELAS